MIIPRTSTPSKMSLRSKTRNLCDNDVNMKYNKKRNGRKKDNKLRKTTLIKQEIC